MHGQTSEEGITSWAVKTDGIIRHHTEHNHRLEPRAARHARRNKSVSDEQRVEIRSLAAHNMKPTDLAQLMSGKYKDLLITAKDVSNISSKDGFPADWGQAARVVSLLQSNKQHDAIWVNELR